MAPSATAPLPLQPDLAGLLTVLDAQANLVQRHLWLIALMQWIRGPRSQAQANTHAQTAAQRVDLLLDILDARPETAARLQTWWSALLATVDGTTLLSDYGFASRNAFLSELLERLHRQLLPATPETADACELFSLALPSPLDAQWLAALSPSTLARLTQLLTTPVPVPYTYVPPTPSTLTLNPPPSLTYWQHTLLEAITACTSQIRAAGFSPELRLRMSTGARGASPFHTLASSFDALRDAWLVNHATDAAVEQAAHHFRTQLDACRQAASTVYTHLDAHGISVDLVFRLRQLRQRVLRIRALLDCLLGDPSHAYSAKLLSHLASVGQEQRSIGALITASSSLLAAKAAERSSETGEHYITRTRAEYRAMLITAAGGGALTAITTALKFALMLVGLSAFWFGFWSGMVYAASFVVIQLMHFTLATKQPAMTAPAMAAKLKDTTQPGAIEAFVDEVTHLVRSQMAAVLGNVVVVFPLVVLISVLLQLASGQPMIDAERAEYVLHSLTLLGPSALFAAFTGVLLFASSIIAGWVENWFVLHRLDSAMRYNPRITQALGPARADAWAHFMLRHISGFAANISLGFMLGLVPAILGFLGLGLDVRHVTLSAGQLGAACASLGWDVFHHAPLWWAVASIPVIGLCNLGVSFTLAFRVALQAHNVSDLDRKAIYKAIALRVRQAPLGFFWPARETTPA